ncbi:hypothetical protein IOK49_00975 [Fervidicoccus fontis]|jgi:hypothetical protein|uniref:Uncharacterized protein n=2 Tax=Fervidicoccus fontis TaxID=683846 RepID=I0A2S5_FERFK|nr:hypothetical protein [Fervidicoccus fontis]AFH43282.1 hypothetical protein FFONT_1294 [Fervidicoccus fontis Kam940]MBE9390660.1 hypothetical protein [Fervidicoccus fontis]
MQKNIKQANFLDIESMALGNKLASVKIENCGEETSKIVAEDNLGNIYETPCEQKKIVSKSYMIINNYIKWSKLVLES